MKIPTPHIEAGMGEFAETVLMPGDPQRARFIADSFLKNVTLVTQVRGILGYTGYFGEHRVSVMASGMGIPSICIYAHELFNFYGVKNIIRIGSAGAINSDLKLLDIVVGLGACTDVDYSKLWGVEGVFAPIASFELLAGAVKAAENLQISVKVGNILSSDLFYSGADFKKWRGMGVLAVEMEAAGLYYVAAKAQKNALCICTISDIPATGEALSAKERQKNLKSMVEIALCLV
ncbi:MAG: purine-nucleoside phosphorylase [Oscillospiraceae bacterium]|jgi:purine-nucleoside phosphorylase|nr:purine-nucleoside phosphorylase [Oscillospiraceae bacterium]